MSNKIFIVVERTRYEGIDDILHAFLSEKEAERAVEYYREKYIQEYGYGEYSYQRYRYMIRDIEEEFKP